MGWLNNTVAAIWRAVSPKAGKPAPDDDFWYQEIGGQNHAGVVVTPDLALKASAVYACVKVLAETIATLPLDMYRVLPDGGREKAPEHPLHAIIKYQPNNWQTAVEFWETMMLHAALRGGAYAEIVPGPRGAVDQLVPLHTDRVTVERLPGYRLRFRVRDDVTGTERVLLQDEVFRIPGMSSDGVRGLRAVDLAAEAIGLGLAADAYAARVFSNRLNLGGYLVHPGKLSPEAQKNLIHSLMMKLAGVENAHRPIVLQEGMEFKSASQTAEQAQLLEARKWQVAEIARFWRIPLHMLNIYDGATHSNVEQQALDLVKYTLRPWVKRIEQAIRRDLIVAKESYVAKFNLEGLLRGDAASRAEYFAKALGAGGHPAWMTPNEVRKAEGLNVLPSGDALNPGANADKEANGAQRVARKEVVAVRRAMMRLAGDEEGFKRWVKSFYGSHVGYVQQHLGLPKVAARKYCERQRDMLLRSDDVEAVVQTWEHGLADEIEAALRTLRNRGTGNDRDDS